jgi:nitroreductase
MDKAAAIVAVVMDPASRWWLEDGSAAIQNMLLAATALGYGSCWLEGWTLRHEDEFKALLKIPADKRLLTLIPLGVPEAWPTREKKPLSEMLYWEKYPG